MAELDLFSSEKTTHCPLWFACMETLSPLRQDVVSHDCLLSSPLIPLLWETLPWIAQGKHTVAVQTMVSLAPNLVGGQTEAGSVQEGYALPAGRSYLASKSSLSTVMGMASGTNSLLADCEPSGLLSFIHSVSQSCVRWKPEDVGIILFWPNPVFLSKVLLLQFMLTRQLNGVLSNQRLLSNVLCSCFPCEL